ncbi:TetR/AcrR family transcriptional regulator [Amnibacterium kyonggiense]
MIDGPSGAVEVDRRARRRELRRDAIYEAALALFAERGFEGTTMEDVAVQADVARATVFNHFPQKAAFLQEWAARRRRRALDAARAGSAAGEGLRDVLVRFFTVMGEPREASRSETAALILGTAHSTNIWLQSPLAEDLARILAAAQQRGELGRGSTPTTPGCSSPPPTTSSSPPGRPPNRRRSS